MDSCPPGSRGPSRNQACLFTCLALTALLLIVVSVPVRATPKLQTFHIDAGDAVRTLNEFSRQSSLQLLFDYNVVTGRRTHAVSGDLPAIVALQKMLEDTGLSFEYVNDRTLSIAAVNHDTGAGSAVAAAPAPDNGRTRAAVVQGVGRNESGSAVVRNDWRTAEPQEIVVTGTHLRGEQPVGDHVIS